jgi:hypothetical protein
VSRVSIDGRFKMLCSYWYFKDHDMDDVVGAVTGQKPLVFADSGAHSARTQGVDLRVDEYAAWVKRWGRHLDVVSNLDVIGAPANTWRNQRILEEVHGLKVLPVFHTGEPWEWLERYIDAGHTYIALGKLLGNSWKILEPWLAKAFRIAGDRAVFHGFGLNVWQALREYPFYSVDSSSWGQGFRYGQLKMFDRGRWVTATLREHKSVIANRGLIRAHGADPLIFLDPAKYERQYAVKLAAVAHKKAEHWLRERHGPIHIPGDEANRAGPGLHSYVADTVIRQFRLASKAIEETYLEGHIL